MNHHHESQKQVINRLSRIEGHVRSVKTMVSEGRDCPDVLLQIAAIRKALDSTAKIIFADHLKHCLVHAIQGEEEDDALENFQKALDHYIR